MVASDAQHGHRRATSPSAYVAPRSPVCPTPIPSAPARADAAPAGGGESVAIEVATPAAEEPSELEAAVLAAARGYRFGEIEVPATIARAIE